MKDEVFARVTQGAQEAVEIHHLRAELEASETELRIVRASQAESNAEVERLRAELAEAQEKALRCDLDMAGIERREQEATELVQLRAELAECRREMDLTDSTINKMADLLKRTAIALRGPEPSLTRWSWHDLPERAEAAIAAIDVMQRAAIDAALAAKGE